MNKPNNTKTVLKKDTDKNKMERLNIELVDVALLIKESTKYNTEIGFFMDMKIPSGKNRFFVYDFKAQKIIDEGLVAHGSGSETGVKNVLKFSNIENSYSTSLGRYAIGYSYEGRFGKAYKLNGLDESNSKAFDRHIVLHKYEDVPYEEQEQAICNSQGCPMVNPEFYTRLEKIIDHSDKEIILKIYY